MSRAGRATAPLKLAVAYTADAEVPLPVAKQQAPHHGEASKEPK